MEPNNVQTLPKLSNPSTWPDTIAQEELEYLASLQLPVQIFLQFLSKKYRLPNGSSIDPATGIITRA